MKKYLKENVLKIADTIESIIAVVLVISIAISVIYLIIEVKFYNLTIKNCHF